MSFEEIDEEIIVEKVEIKKIPKYLIYDKNINFTMCKICKNAICYLLPILNEKSEPTIIYKCSERINYNQNLFENNFLLTKRTCTINEYINFINDKNNFNSKNKCYFHEKDYDTLYCVQCQKFFCKKECVKIHNDLVEYHIFSEIEINLKNFCYQHLGLGYKLNFYCLKCKQFLCDICKKNLCLYNENHTIISLNKLKDILSDKISKYLNEVDLLLKQKEEEKDYLFKKLDENCFNNLNKILIEDMKNIILNNLEANRIFRNICQLIFTTYDKFKYFSNSYILGNIVRFLNLNKRLYNKELLNRDYLINFYKKNYLIDFKEVKIFKAIREINIEKIQHVITNHNKTEFIINGEINGESSIFFINNEGKINQDYIKINSKGIITAMIIVKNYLLVLGFTEFGQKCGRLKVYNITDTSKIGKKKNQYSHSAHSSDIYTICEIKDFQILTLSEEPSIKLWNIKDEPLNLNIFYFPNYIIHVNNIIKFNKRKIILIGRDFIYINKFEKKVYYPINLEIKNINLFYLLDEKNDTKKKFFLIVESEKNILLYQTEKIFKPKKRYETQKLSELNLDSNIVNISFFKSYFCCQLDDGNLSIINLVGFFKLNRLFLFNFYSKYLDKCFTFNSSNFNSREKILFTKKNDKNIITGYIIFEEIINNALLDKEIVIS